MASLSLSSLLPTAAGLAMDCTALAVAFGLGGGARSRLDPYRLAIAFGFFQALLFVAGWFSGAGFRGMMAGWDHWIAFLLLLFIGGKMLKESFAADGSARAWNLTWTGISVLALAASLDALAVGLGFSLVGGGLWFAATWVGLFSVLLPLAGYHASSALGARLGVWAERAGGAVLIAIGSKILIEHLARGI